MTSARAVLLVAVVLLVSATGCQTPHNPTSPAVEPTAPTDRNFSPLALKEAREFRASIGLRSDDEWIARVWSDPSSVERYGTWVSPEEARELDARARTVEEMTSVLSAYRLTNEAVWAGNYFDNSTGVMVALVTDDPDPHRLELSKLVSPEARFDVRQVRFTLAELRERRDRIVADQGWFAEIDTALQAVGFSVSSNKVRIELEASDPAVGDRILEHFSAHAWLLLEIRPLTPVFPTGSLVVHTIAPSGEPNLDVHCVLIPDVSGALGADPAPPSTRVDGDCDFNDIAAIGYWVEISEHGTPEDPVLARGRATVAAGRTTTIKVVVAAAPP